MIGYLKLSKYYSVYHGLKRLVLVPSLLLVLFMGLAFWSLPRAVDRWGKTSLGLLVAGVYLFFVLATLAAVLRWGARAQTQRYRSREADFNKIFAYFNKKVFLAKGVSLECGRFGAYIKVNLLTTDSRFQSLDGLNSSLLLDVDPCAEEKIEPNQKSIVGNPDERNFLLADFLQARNDDSGEIFDEALAAKLHRLLEQDILGGDDDDFETKPPPKALKNTNDVVKEQLAHWQADKEDIDRGSILQPLLPREPEVVIEPVSAQSNTKKDENTETKDDQETVFFDVQSIKPESEFYTVMDDDDNRTRPNPEPTTNHEDVEEAEGLHNNADTESALDELEFKSALEFQSVMSFSKNGDNR